MKAGLLPFMAAAAMATLPQCLGAHVPAAGVAPEAHRPPAVAGARYRTVLSALPYSDSTQNPTGTLFNAELAALPVFRDCAIINQTSLRRAPQDRAAYRRLEENYADGSDDQRWRSFAGNPKPDRPLFSYMVTKRDPAALVGPIDLDYAQYAQWKAAHTNFFSFRMLSEWGVDLTHLGQRAGKIVDAARRDELLRTWCAPVADRYAQMALARRYVERMIDLHYGDSDSFAAMRSFFALDHVAAAWGAKALMVETTNTTGPKMDKEYRWAVAGMFARGASRQFDVPWGWYVAVYFNGLRRDGTWMDNSTPSYTVRSPTKFPEAGVSASLFNRVCYYAYLTGAGAVEVESWLSHLLMPDETGRLSLSPRGRLFSAFHDFTIRNPDRGIPYAPVAVLVPFAQGYPATGGKSWSKFDYQFGDYAVDSVFFTLQKGFDRPAAMRRGQEANLHNSPYPVMCDVLSPDSPQDPEAFLAALENYPVAVLAGEYRDRSFEPLLKRYEAAGGRLLRIAPDMLPPFEGDLPGEVFSGRRSFPALDSFFAGVRDEFFPVKVKGDVLWGLNKTEKGWWAWCLNNKGITKFADAFEEIDESAKAAIRVDLCEFAPGCVRELVSGRAVPVRGGGFDWTVPAGGIAVFDIEASPTYPDGAAVEPLPTLPDGAFTYVVIPDTQRYDGLGKKCRPDEPEPTGPTVNMAFESRVRWIEENVVSQRIAFVTHVGDIVDDNNVHQWAFASNLMSRLDGKVPYGVVPGNHDMRDGVGDTGLFSRYFPLSRFTSQPGFDASFPGKVAMEGVESNCGGAADTCRLFEAGGMKFVVVHVECNAPAEVMEWAGRMFDRHSDRHAILATHAYLGPLTKEIRMSRPPVAKAESQRTGRHVNPYAPEDLGRMRWITARYDSGDGLPGEEMWSRFLRRHRNLFLVVCGDQSGVLAYRRESVGDNGNVVSEIMQDYPRAADCDDCLRLYRFIPSERRLEVYTYSPSLGGVPTRVAFKTLRSDHRFDIPFPGSTNRQQAKEK